MHWLDVVRSCRDSRRLVLLIVAVALLLDNMLLTTVGKRPIDSVLPGQPIDPAAMRPRSTARFPQCPSSPTSCTS